MDINTRLFALDSLVKAAQVTQQVAWQTAQEPKAAAPVPAPNNQDNDYARRMAYSRKLRARNGVTAKQMKPGMEDPTRAAVTGFVGGLYDNVADGTFGKNLEHGLTSMGNGIMKGIASVPGALAGLAAGAGSMVKNTFDPNVSWADTFGRAGTAFSNASDWVDNNVGIGSYNLGAAQRRINAWQQNNMSKYMDLNNMDANNLSALERMGLTGQAVANAAGEALGAQAGFSAPGALVKGVNAIRGVRAAANAANTARKAPGLWSLAKGTFFVAPSAADAYSNYNANLDYQKAWNGNNATRQAALSTMPSAAPAAAPAAQASGTPAYKPSTMAYDDLIARALD